MFPSSQSSQTSFQKDIILEETRIPEFLINDILAYGAGESSSPLNDPLEGSLFDEDFPPPPDDLQEDIHLQDSQQHSDNKTEGGKEDIKTNDDDNDNISSVKFVPLDLSVSSPSSSSSSSSCVSSLSVPKAKFSCDYLSESSSLQKSYSSSHLKEKLHLIKIEGMSLRNDYEQNEAFGSSILSRLTDKYSLNKYRVDKLTNHCNEVDTISRLVISLRIRLRSLEQSVKNKDRQDMLAKQEQEEEEDRLHNNEQIVDKNVGGLLHPQTLDNQVSEKRNKLSRQLTEALDLKQLIDNRSHSLMDKLCSSHQTSINQRQEGKEVANGDEVDENDDPSSCRDKTDFLEYVNNKSNIIMRIKEVEEQIDSIEKSLEMQSLN